MNLNTGKRKLINIKHVKEKKWIELTNVLIKVHKINNYSADTLGEYVKKNLKTTNTSVKNGK